MICTLFKTLFKTTLIGTAVAGAVGGAALLAAGPGRTQAVLHELKQRVSTAIDAGLDDPIALREKLAELERAYPERIGELRADQAELARQMAQLERERAISLRVVELAQEDLAALRPRVEEASARAEALPQARLASVPFDSQVLSLQRAVAKVRQIENTQSAHVARAADAENSLVYLRQQAGRFDEALAQLEAEQAEFQVQLAQLNRQVDSIQRNERLIAMLSERQRTLDECASYDCASLQQVTGKLEEILTRQAAELDVLGTQRAEVDYEDLAREELLRQAEVEACAEDLGASHERTR